MNELKNKQTQQRIKSADNKIYNFSFTAGGTLYREAMIVIDDFMASRSWDITRYNVVENNLLCTRTKSSSQRLFRELFLRLSNLHEQTIDVLFNLSEEALQKQIIWISICKTYPFISDFLGDVVLNKIDALDYALGQDDYNRFFNKKAQWHGELDALSQSTQIKIRQVLFKMLREMGFLSKTGVIIPLFTIDDCIINIIKTEIPDSPYIFPLSQRLTGEAHA